MNNQKNIIKDYHLPQLLNGNITGGIWTYYTDVNKPLCKFNQAIDYIMDEIELASDYIHIVKNKEDIKPNKVNVLLGFESLQPIKDLKHLKKMVDLGFRHAMLTWNEENHFATGVHGSENRGLTEQGVELIEFMNKNHMLIDISHANIHTADEILKASTSPVIASHSNIYNLCPNPRNLQDFQILKLTGNGGAVGITAVKSFVNPKEPTVANMVNHIDYLKEKNLVNHIMLGLDFMDYLNGPFNNSNLTDLPSAQFTYNLIEELNKRNYTEDEVNKITHKNALRIINQVL
jgi:membrane dipeptidase